jgi:septal ring factor EnvC (AmiA/AmiB activator)
MARNRKYQSAAVRFGPALKAILLCAVIGGSGLGYVWQRSQIDELARQIKKKESLLADLKDQTKKLQNQLAMQRTVTELQKRVRELKLGMGQAQHSQIWLLPEPPAVPTANAGDQLAAQQIGQSLPR